MHSTHSSGSSRRTVIDVSTLARWAGPPVGIVRAERELALWARTHVDRVLLAFFDPVQRRYRELRPEWIDAIFGDRATINPWTMPDLLKSRDRQPARVRAASLPAVRWILQSRRQLLFLLERLRLQVRSADAAGRIDAIQRHLMSERYRAFMINPAGERRALLPRDLALGEAVDFGPGDTLVCAGSSWGATDIGMIRDVKRRVGMRLVILCFDLIPIQFPQFYKAHDVAAFRDHYRVAFPTADLVIFSARKVEQDAIGHCRAHGIPIGRTAVVPLGGDASPAAAAAAAAAPLPAGLEDGRYVLFVSTIEPRKGHQLLYDVWLKLLDDGIPQSSGVKLVFVGRRGWLVDKLIDQLATDPRLSGTLLMLPRTSDAGLARLYMGAAFCVYPSIYEGYGLPVVEAFSYGKAVIASTGGAIPEVAGDFSPCLDPLDEAIWYETIKRWILQPEVRAGFEERIRSRFAPVTWREAAARFFAEVDRAGAATPSPTGSC